MFSTIEVDDYVRVEPKLFGLATAEAVKQQLFETYKGYVNKEVGFVVSVEEVLSIGEGIIIHGDGAAYYNTKFRLIVFKPELQELVFGEIAEITSFGAFIDLGVMQGMIHISQTMEDYVSFSKTGTLVGKSGKKSLKKEDLCLARIVAISYKGDDPKIGLTMRQPGLGKIEWIKLSKKKPLKTEKIEKSGKIKREKK
ncbi:MAG: DNA-directed RNA polymerase [Nanoarchaeota archaeon]